MAGKLQNEDHKTEAELLAAGGVKAQLLNDTKIYSTVLSETLDDAITQGLLQRPGVVGTVGAPQAVTTQIDVTSVNTRKDIIIFVTGTAVITLANIVGGAFIGQCVKVIGVVGANIEITDGAVGPITIVDGSVANYVFNGTSFQDDGRNS